MKVGGGGVKGYDDPWLYGNASTRFVGAHKMISFTSATEEGGKVTGHGLPSVRCCGSFPASTGFFFSFHPFPPSVYLLLHVHTCHRPKYYPCLLHINISCATPHLFPYVAHVLHVSFFPSPFSSPVPACSQKHCATANATLLTTLSTVGTRRGLR